MGVAIERNFGLGSSIASIYARRAGGTTEEWREIMRAETWYFASEALEAGLIDEVLEPPAREDDDDAAERDAGVEADRQNPGRDRPAFRFAGRQGAPPPLTRRTEQRFSIPTEAEMHARRGRSLAARFGG